MFEEATSSQLAYIYLHIDRLVGVPLNQALKWAGIPLPSQTDPWFTPNTSELIRHLEGVTEIPFLPPLP